MSVNTNLMKVPSGRAKQTDDPVNALYVVLKALCMCYRMPQATGPLQRAVQRLTARSVSGTT